MEKRTKIIATIGPVTSNKDALRRLILKGANVFRLNLSHGEHEIHRKNISMIRELEIELQTDLAILTDLQGPKLRIGEIENDKVFLQNGAEIHITTAPVLGTEECISITYPDFLRDVRIGEAVLIDDGKIKLEVVGINSDMVTAKVIYGGALSSRKGVNLPNTTVSLPSLTEKDLEDARFAIEEGVNWIGLSFVRAASDLKPLRALIHSMNKPISIIAKIEKPEAFNEIDEIIREADAIMVARGDLGVEMSFEQVPVLQKMIVDKCREQAKPVIIATQMLESMVSNFRPTRAEASDVANAVTDGADAVMLSGETSVGDFPEESVSAMRKIISYTENFGYSYGKEIPSPEEDCPTYIPDSICYHAFLLSLQINAKAIVIFTNSGYTARRIAAYRPESQIYAFTNNQNLVHKMVVLWGTKAYYYKEFANSDAAIEESIQRLKEEGKLTTGDFVLHVGNIPIDERSSANMLRISKIK